MSRLLVLIVVIYLILASAYALTIPIGEAPDEPAHFLYARYLAETGNLPPPAPLQTDSFWKHGFVTSGYEWHQLPPAYGIMAGVLTINRWARLVPPFDEFPEINPAFPGQGIPLFVASSFRFSDVHLLRLSSILVGLGTLLTIYWTVRRVWPAQEDLALLATAFAALIPQFIFLQAYITNDTLTILMSNLGLAVLVNVAMTESQNARRAWILAGVVCSLAISTKLTTWFLIPLAAVLVLLLLYDGRARSATLKDFLFFILALPLFPLLFWLLFPDLLMRVLNSPQSLGIQPDYASIAHFVDRVLPILHTSFWGMFGWVNIPISSVFIVLLDGVALVGLGAGAVVLIRCWRSLSAGQRSSIVILGMAIGLVFLQFIAYNLTNFQGQGRYLYSAIAAIGFFIALGWMYLAGQRSRWLMVAFLGLMVAINIVVYMTTIVGTYWG